MDKYSRVTPLFWTGILYLLLLTSCNPQGNSGAATDVPTAAYPSQAVESETAENIDPALEQPATVAPYPGPKPVIVPSATVVPDSYPAPTSAAVEAITVELTPSAEVFLPITGDSSTGNSSDNTDEAPTAIPLPTPIPTIAFAAVQENLRTNGKDLGFVKIGFHATLLEDRDALDDWMNRLDQAGVPIFLKATDNAEPLYRAQELMKISGVPHTLVYRSTGGEPLYELPPEQAAQIHWQEHRDKFPPELDPSMVWIETLNEPDRTKDEWFGQFALEMARMTMSEGYKWAAFSWASGEPEPEHWQTPSMLAFLQLAGENPDRLAIALHEYSYLKEDLAHEYPYKVGRFQELFRIADAHGFARPTVLITEWGWEYDNIPSPEKTMRDIEWASGLYAPYPEVKGAGIWNLGIGCCFGDISEQVQQIIEPLTEYSLKNFFAVPLPPDQQAIDPEKYRP